MAAADTASATRSVSGVAADLAQHQHRVVGGLQPLVVAEQHRVAWDDAAAGEQDGDVDVAAATARVAVAGPLGSIGHDLGELQAVGALRRVTETERSTRRTRAARRSSAGARPSRRSDTVLRRNFFAVCAAGDEEAVDVDRGRGVGSR